MARNVVIMGAAGKDFHVFNTVYRGDPNQRVVAFTATQIPGIDGRRYPPELAGPSYPKGIEILPEDDLEKIIDARKVDHVVFAYSDVSYDTVEQHRARVVGAGATFETAPTDETMLKSTKPVIAVGAVRTGCGKSQTSRAVVEMLASMGKKVVAARHPMPYGDLAKQACQRFATLEDLEKHECTIEEMEEYEPYISRGMVVYAGVDYEMILREAEKEADVVLWDGGNNDIPFFAPDLYITVVDPHRAGHELSYYPGRENFERADVLLFNKMDSAPAAGVKQVQANAERYNPKAVRIYADSPLRVENPDCIRGKKVLVVEDGPTLTHGGMTLGAGTLAAKQYEAAELVDPRPWLVGTLKETFENYPGIGTLLPAMGYGAAQCQDLQETIANVECDSVVIGTPIDLSRVVTIDKPHTRVHYDLSAAGREGLREQIEAKLFARA